MSLQVTQLSGFGGSASGDAFAYVSDAADDTNRSTYTFSAQDIGAEAADRLVIVGLTHNRVSGGFKLSSATIGGVSATIHVAQFSGSGFTVGGAIISAEVPSGVSADIILTMEGTLANCQISVYRATGLVSSTSHDTDSARQDEGTGPTLQVNVPSNGILVAVAATVTDTLTASWTGATEDIDQDAGEIRQTSASESGLPSETSRNVKSLWSGSADNAILVATWS